MDGKVLLTNFAINRLGGSETATFTTAQEFTRRGYHVEVLSSKPRQSKNQLVAQKLEAIGVTCHFNTHLSGSYDLILANHKTTIPLIKNASGFKIQTCHGIFPAVEQPVEGVAAHVSISQEVYEHLQNKGFNSTIIHNGVNCDRFRPIKKLNSKLTKVLSLVHSDSANKIIKEACDIIGVEFVEANKHKVNLWDVENLINDADLVVSLGRGVYESMACGRNIVIFDHRAYTKMPAIGDGFVTVSNIEQYLTCNCSGRATKTQFTAESLVKEFNKYTTDIGDSLRQYALEHLNIKHQVDRYLKLL